MIHRSPSIGAKSRTFCLDIFDFDNASRSRISTVVSNFKKKSRFLDSIHATRVAVASISS